MTLDRTYVAAALAAAGLIALMSGAGAGEGPLRATHAKPDYDWSGFYVGAAAGARRTDSNLSIRAIDEFYMTGAGQFIQHDFPGCTLNTPPCASGASFDTTAFRMASYAGYNWEVGSRWVVGLEADWGWANNAKTQNGFAFFFGPGVAIAPDSTYTVKSLWDASARVRLGYRLAPAFLVYATGGAAWMKTDVSSFCGAMSCDPIAFSSGVVSQSRLWSGWTAGGGVETSLGAGWLARAEYRYADFGSASFTDIHPCNLSPCSVAPSTLTSVNVSYDVSMKTHTAMFGLAYKFGGSAAD